MRLSAFPRASLDALGEALPGVFYELAWRENVPIPAPVLETSWYSERMGKGVFVPVRIGGRVRALLGEDPESILDDPEWWYRRLHPEDRVQAVEQLGRLWRRGRLVQRYRLVRPDGQVVHVQDTMRLWRDAAGKPRITGLWVDVSDQELDRELLVRAFELSPHAIVVITLRDGRLLAANGAFEALSGYLRTQVIGKTLGEIGLWEDARIARRMLGLLVRHGHVRGAHLVVRRKDGERRECEVHASRLEIMGEPCALVEVADITERLAHERQLAEHEARWRTLLENLPDGVLVHDGKKVRYANPNAEEIFRAPLAGKPLDALVMAEDKALAEAHLAAVHRGERKTTEMRMRRANGEVFPAEVRTALTSEGGRTRFLCVVRDISERKAMEARMREMERMRAVATLASGLAHDFNNVLTAITGNLYLLRRALAHDPDLLVKIARVEDAAERASGMIAQLLSFARGREAEAQVMDLRALLKETAKLARAAIPEAIAFSFCDETQGAHVHVRADPGQLQQVVLNLIKNAHDAVRASKAPAIRLVLDCAPPPGEQGAWAHLRCEDNGPGIPEHLHERVFEPFFTTKPEGEGTGLGLAIVRQVVQAHGGHCKLENRPEGGLAVHLWLPLAQKPAREPASTQEAVPLGHGETVLLVDDNEPLRTALAEALAMLGYRVVEAASAEEALTRFEELQGRVDALISDIVMPGEDGCTLARRLRARQPGLVVILQTGHGERERGALCDCAEEEATLLAKPVHVEELARVLAARLERAHDQA